MPAKTKADELSRTAEEAPTEQAVVEENLPEEITEEAPKSRRARRQKAKEEVMEEPLPNLKPNPTSAKAVSKNVRVTPRKARLVIDLVRGKSVDEAIGILDNVNKAASVPVKKTIQSAAANATNNFGMDRNSLYVAEIYANDGFKMKRYLPRAKGRASHLVKRTCHITCVVKMR